MTTFLWALEPICFLGAVICAWYAAGNRRIAGRYHAAAWFYSQNRIAEGERIAIRARMMNPWRGPFA